MWKGNTSRSTVARLLAVGCLALAAMGAHRAGAEVNDKTAGMVAGLAQMDAVPLAPRPEGASLSAAFALGVPRSALPPPPTLRLQMLGTNEQLELVPFEHDGAARREDMDKLAWLFAPLAVRSSGEKAVAPDARLVELLLKISKELGGKPIVIVSGHRKPGRGTSHKSFHVRGMAADISVVGVKSLDVRKAALAAGAKGVGLYPGYVHVDAREEKFLWSAGGGRRRH